MKDTPLVEIKNLKKYFNMGSGAVLKAVDDVSLFIKKGETLGLVGESGCGKSTLGRTIIGLYEATGGKIFFEGNEIKKLKDRDKRAMTRQIQMIFQDPYASLNPRMTVGDIIGEGIDIHKISRGRERNERICYLLKVVGLNKEQGNRFPHEFSGGQRQRIGIARALAIEPKFIICDEPISALDVSIQAQVVNLLMKLQSELDLTYLFIAHDLNMVKHISHRIAVMYLGTVVELASGNDLYKRPTHPYTKALLSAIPIPDPDAKSSRKRILLQGDVPSPINPLPGCRFRSRCVYKAEICGREMPALREIGKEHFVACHNL